METQETQVVDKKSVRILIPWASCLRFGLFLASIALAWYGLKVVVYFCRGIGLNTLDPRQIQVYSPHQLVILPWLFIEYFLVSLIPVCFAAWCKKGFLYVYNFEDGGLITKLIGWFIFGSIGGFIVGFCVCVNIWLGGYEFISGLIGWLITLLIAVFGMGLIGGFTFGLISEFK